MAYLEFKCPFCGQKLRVDESLREKRIKCPKCQQQFVLPESEKSDDRDDQPRRENVESESTENKEGIVGRVLRTCRRKWPEWLPAIIALALFYKFVFLPIAQWVGCCFSNSPKGVVEAFINACNTSNYERAAKMYHPGGRDTCAPPDDTAIVFVSGKAKHWSAGRFKCKISKRPEIPVQGDPNRCDVLVDVESDQAVTNNKQQVKWRVEKIDGDWKITIIDLGSTRLP